MPSLKVLLAGSLLPFVQLALAGQKGWITLINSTPYEWRLTYSHQYQMRWSPLPSIPSFTSQEFPYEFKRNKDDGAEATYEIIGHPTKASFTVQARGAGPKRIEIQYHDHLSSLNNPENSLINLGWERNGAVPFILSGTGIDTPFVSSNPPVAWMQATLPTIGHKSMSEICMLASHDAGTSEITRSYFGVKNNVITQSVNVYEQLVNGARFFDIRPVVRKNKWYTAHLTVVSDTTAFGGFGRTIRNIVSDVNRFTSENPGELIVLDISHDLDRKGWKPLNAQQWQDFYREMLAINDIWPAPSTLAADITRVPILTFIQPGSKSAVLIRIPDYAPLPDTQILFSRSLVIDAEKLQVSNITTNKDDEEEDSFETPDPAEIPHPLPGFSPSSTPSTDVAPTTPKINLLANTTLGFFPESRLYFTGGWTGTEDPATLTTDQLNKLNKYRPSLSSPMHRSTWTITQGVVKALDPGTPKHSILAMSALAHRVLFRELWTAMSANLYPNLIEVDDIWGSQFAVLCMAINDHFVGGDEVKLVRRERKIWEVLEDDTRRAVKTVDRTVRGVIRHGRD